MSNERVPRRLGEALDRVVAGLSAPPTRRAGAGDPVVNGVASLFARWEQLVGPDIAAHARPLGVEDDQLVVSADDAAWAAELRWLAADVVARIEARGGPRLAGLRIRVRPR